MSHSSYEHLNGRAETARAFISLSVLTTVIQTTLSLASIQGLKQNFPDNFAILVNVAEQVLFVCAVIYFLRWLDTAASNARAINPQVMKTSRVMTMLCWFIPIYNFLKPYLVMKQLWAASCTEQQAPVGSGKLLIFWWLFWTLHGPVSFASFYVLMYLGLEPATEVVPTFFIIKTIGVVVPCLLLIRIINLISQNQDMTYAFQQAERKSITEEIPSGDVESDVHTIHLNKPNVVQH